MHIRKISFLIFILSLLLVMSSYSQNRLLIKLVSEREVYEPGQLMCFRLYITNTGSDQYNLEYNCSFVDDALWALEFMNDNGKKYTLSTGGFSYCCIGGSLAIKSGDTFKTVSLTVTYKLLKFYGYKYLPPGKYSVYFDRPDLGKSNAVSFRVLEADSNTSLGKFLRADSLKDKYARFTAFRDLLYDSTCKAYHGRAVLEMAYILYENDFIIDIEKLKHNLLYFFERNSNSMESETILALFCRTYGLRTSEKEAYEYLAAISNKFSKTLLGDLADAIIGKENFPDVPY